MTILHRDTDGFSNEDMKEVLKCSTNKCKDNDDYDEFDEFDSNHTDCDDGDDGDEDYYAFLW